jgi:alkylation response protein AidB-like acyl-CoA dehydrogenase
MSGRECEADRRCRADAWRRAQKLWAQTRNLAAIGLAAEQVGVAERALNLAVDYTKERQQFGKAVGSFQGVKHRAAQMLVKVETADQPSMLQLS